MRKLTFHNAGLIGLTVLFAFSLAPQSVSAQRLAQDRMRDGSSVKKAFAKVVKEPRRWTVRIQHEKKDVALGTIVESDGWILTKYSQLPDGPLTCKLTDQRTFPAKVVGADQAADLAMLQIEASDLPAVQWASTGDPGIGRWLVTPGLAESPIAVGVMSVRRRAIRPNRGLLGVSIEDAKPGARVTRVFAKSAADRAGVKVGDVIVSVQGESIRDDRSLIQNISRKRPGDRIVFRVIRGYQEFDLMAVLLFPTEANLSRGAIQNQMGGKLSTRRGGFKMAIQHDTVLRPEDCGGPIIDLSGKAVGINIARGGRTESYALPPDVLKPLIAQLKSGQLSPLRIEKRWLTSPPPPSLPEG